MEPWGNSVKVMNGLAACSLSGHSLVKNWVFAPQKFSFLSSISFVLFSFLTSVDVDE
jgi:hypothetical protein